MERLFSSSLFKCGLKGFSVLIGFFKPKFNTFFGTIINCKNGVIAYKLYKKFTPVIVTVETFQKMGSFVNNRNHEDLVNLAVLSQLLEKLGNF